MNNHKVIGSFVDRQEAKREIHTLIKQGFRKEQVTIYTNETQKAFFSDVESVQVAQPDTAHTPDEHDEDKNFWESIRDAFKVREDTDFEDPNYVPEDDLLHPYREDLSNGRFVIVVDETGGRSVTTDITSEKGADTTPTPPLETLGTTAGFPDEGSVQGMGDGGQPHADSDSADGTPPELEDVEGTADESAATQERLNSTRRDHL